MAELSPEEQLRDVLTGVHPGLADYRRRLKHIPSSPRCKLCTAPFGGIGGAILGHFGFGRYEGNPALCNMCIKNFSSETITGAEIPVTLLFADVRGSTRTAEGMRPTEFHAFLNRFYRIGSGAIVRHDGLVDKLVGDEIIGLFFGGVSGPGHVAAAIAAGTDLMTEVGRPDGTMAPIPVGAAVRTGEAYVGTTAPDGVINDFTALGDVVNTTARLASAAAAGELLVSVAAADAAGDHASNAERRTLEVRGREATIDVVVLHPTESGAAIGG